MTMRGLFSKLSRRAPDAAAYIRGSVDYPELRAYLDFHTRQDGMIVCIRATDLPHGDECEEEYVFVITCNGREIELPPLYSSRGAIETMFLTERICPLDIASSAIILYMTKEDSEPLLIGSGVIR